MGRVRARILLSLYLRRLGYVSFGGVNRHVLGTVVPCAGVSAGAGSFVVGNSTIACAAVIRSAGVEEGLPFVSAATQHYFGAVARAWVGDPLGHILTGPTPNMPLGAGLEDLICTPSASDGVEPAHVAVSGQWLAFVQWAAWQPGILVEDGSDIFNFWLVRGLTQGQSRVSQVLSGYYLSLLQAQFRCRVGLHIECSPAERRGDAAFVRLLMARWR